MKRLGCIVWLCGATFAATPLGATASDYPSTPKAVLEKYLSLDAEAAGLAPETWPELGQYVTYPQAPAWQTFVVINGYAIDKVIEGHTRAQVRVTYRPLGQLSDKWIPGSRPESVVFHLNKVENQWKVDSPAVMPHVSFAVMKKRLSAASAAHPKEKKANEALIAQIEAVRQRLK